MAISVDWANKIINSTASITDLPVFHAALRDLEDDATGAIYPVTHTWKALDLGSGAFFYQLDLINGYQLKFPNAGNYTISGNLNATVVPVAGVYVERKTSAAYITTAVGGSGPSASDIAAAVWQRAIENSHTSEQMMRIMFAALAGTSEQAGSTIVFKSADGATSRIIGSFDAANNRVGVILDGH